MAFSRHEPCQNDTDCLNQMNLNLRSLAIYENIIQTEDFNLCAENTPLEATLKNYNLSNLINKPTYYQSNSATCIYVILTNKNNLFKISDIFETSFSDHRKLILTILMSEGFKRKPKEKLYRSYKQFNSEAFKNIWNLDRVI